MTPPGDQPLTYTLKLKIPGIDAIGRFSSCQGLEVSMEVYEYAEGGNNDFVHRLPGRLTYPNLLLTRGLTSEEALLKWFFDTHNKVETKEITITASGGGSTRSWTFADAFPIHWSGPQQIRSDTADIGTETLEIVHSGLKMA